MSVTDILKAVEKRMKLEIDDIRFAFTHAGLKGTALENALVDTLLRPCLPQAVGICSGQAFDSQGSRSRQLDIIIYDALRTPILKSSSAISLVPIECIWAVVEVKARLNSVNEMAGVFDNMESVRALKPSKMHQEKGRRAVTASHYGRDVTHFPILYSCFVYESVAASTIETYLSSQMTDRNSGLWNNIDMLMACDVGLWTLNCDDVGFQRVGVGREIVDFYLRLQDHLTQAMSVPQFVDLREYLKEECDL